VTAGTGSSKKSLEPRLSAAISTRYFVDDIGEDNWLYAGGLVAAELHTEYGTLLVDELEEEENDMQSGADDDTEREHRLGRIPP